MKNRRKAVQPFEIKRRKIDIFRNYEANGFEKNQRKFENFSTLISKKSKFANSLSPSELIQAINSLQVRKEDCSSELFMVLRQKLLNFAIEKKIRKKAHLTSKLFQQEEGCRKAGLFKHYKRKSSTGAFLH